MSYLGIESHNALADFDTQVHYLVERLKREQFSHDLPLASDVQKRPRVPGVRAAYDVVFGHGPKAKKVCVAFCDAGGELPHHLQAVDRLHVPLSASNPTDELEKSFRLALRRVRHVPSAAAHKNGHRSGRVFRPPAAMSCH